MSNFGFSKEESHRNFKKRLLLRVSGETQWITFLVMTLNFFYVQLSAFFSLVKIYEE